MTASDQALSSERLRIQAALFAAALVVADWTVLLLPVHGYGWHVLAAVSVLSVEGALHVCAPSPFGWVRWGPSLRHFARVSAACALVSLVLIAVAVAVIRLGDLRFALHPHNVPDPSAFWSWFWFAVVAAPLVEEWVYRGLIQPRLRAAVGVRWAIFGSGVLFWMYHWVGWGGITAPIHLLAGWLLAWSWQRTGSLVAPTLLHALGNLTLGLGDMLLLTAPDLVESILGW